MMMQKNPAFSHTGQRWSEFIDQLINEQQSNLSSNEKVRQLLDAVREVLLEKILDLIFALIFLD